MNAALLKSSFARILAREHGLVAKFYDNLFARRPDFRRLFVGPRDDQEKMLARALLAMVDRLDDAPWTEQQLTMFGARHARYGVTDEMYAPFGQALLATLAEAAGPEWTSETAASWAEAFQEIASMMQKGARATTPAPKTT